MTKLAWNTKEGAEDLHFEGDLVRYKYWLKGKHKYMTAAMLPRFKGNAKVTLSIKVEWDSKEYNYNYNYYN
jgi:predicted phosphohydrolase